MNIKKNNEIELLTDICGKRQAIVKNDTNLSIEKIMEEINVKRSEYIPKQEFIKMIDNMDFDCISYGNLTLITGYKCYRDKQDKEIVVETLERRIDLH